MGEVVAHWSANGVRAISAMIGGKRNSRLACLLDQNGSTVVSISNPLSLVRLFCRENPDLVIAFGLRASLFMRFATAMGRSTCPMVDARNGLEATRSRVLWLVDRITQRWVDVFLTNSDAVAVNLLNRGFDPCRVKTLYSAIGDEWVKSDASAPRRPASIAMVGNARVEKRHELGIRAFASLNVSAHLTVYTDDSEILRAEWDALRASGAIGEVEFVEKHRVSPEDLRQVAIVLHPSSHESAPRALMEARASGCHVVAFDVGDTSRIVNAGGDLIPIGQEDALDEVLARAVGASIAGKLNHSHAEYPAVESYASALLRVADR